MNMINQSWTADVNFPSYTPGDEQRITDFFHRCGYQNSLEFWYWINQKSPEGDTIFRYAELEGRIISHYSVLPQVIYIDKERYLAGLGIHMASDPEYRSLQVLIELVEKVYDACQRAGISLIYGFPNDNSWLISQRLLGWKAIADIPAMEIGATSLAEKINISSQSNIVPLHFHRRHTEILTNRSNFCAIEHYKSPSYLNWRYTKHPEENYYLLVDGNRNTFSGFLVLKLYQKQETKYGHVLEWGIPRESMELLEVLLGGATRFFLRNKIDVVSCWMTKRDSLSSNLIDIGFRPKGFTTHFGYRVLSEGIRELDNKDWSITMGDSDAF